MTTANPYKRRQEIYNCILGKDASEIINADNNDSIKNNLIRQINNEFGLMSRSSSQDSFEMLDSNGDTVKPTQVVPTPSSTNPPSNKQHY